MGAKSFTDGAEFERGDHARPTHDFLAAEVTATSGLEKQNESA